MQDVVDEIIEKTPDNMLSVPSILRKITQIRDNLIRNYGASQRETETIVSSLDLISGQSQYPLPCPQGNVVDVDVKGLWVGLYEGYLCGDCSDEWTQPMTYNTGTSTDDTPSLTTANCWFRLPYRQFDEYYNGPYYYFLSGTIGLVPTPCKDVIQGLKIFHTPVLLPLTVESMNGPTGFDPNYDMVLVYGVLKDATRGPDAAEYTEKYKQWEYEYKLANSGYSRLIINDRWRWRY